MNLKKNLFLLGLFVALFGCSAKIKPPAVYISEQASPLERLAAAEIRRYLYLTTGSLSNVIAIGSPKEVRAEGIIICGGGRPWLGENAASAGFESVPPERLPRLGPEDYWLKTLVKGRKKFLWISGGEGAGVLYGAYALAEKIGVRFGLEGDIVPDEQSEFHFPDLDETGRPLFSLRGIQPFHDFAEGPDWWNEDTYKAVLGQLPKLKMNFFGLHTYPEKNPNAEPAVWIGAAEDFGENGRVTFSYPSSWQNTRRSNPGSHNWGYKPKPTSGFHSGSAELFESDDFGPEVMTGLMPEPASPEDSNELFNRAAAMLRSAFTLARNLGIKTCVGTETPLTIPALVQERLRKQGQDPKDPRTVRALYAGMFKRLAAAYPIDYYWFWTSENWTWSDASDEAVKAVTTDLAMAVQAAKDVAASFSLATCGWVLGPPSRRTLFDEVLPKEVAASCINREVGKAPVDPAFARISGRSKWAIPWMEDDPALTSPQLWAGRMRRDAVDARGFGCDGLLGIHWRTRILSPNVQALARAAWDQSWNMPALNFADLVGPVNGRFVQAPEKTMPGAGAKAIYRDVRDRVFGYRILVPDGIYKVTLQFCETEFDRRGARVFDIFLQGRRAAEAVDIFGRAGRYKPFDLDFRNVEVRGGRLAIDFGDRIHYPSIAGLVVEGMTAAGTAFGKKINCGGPKVLDYDGDWPETPRSLAVEDFYLDWARNQFGRPAGAEIAGLFARLDGKLPLPVNWTDGPGGIRPDPRPWAETAGSYAFADELAAWRPRIRGAGSLERFDYWLKNFEIMRETARFQCLWAEYNAALEKVKSIAVGPARVTAARETLVPKRTEMVKSLRTILGNLAATVSNTGELGTIANWEQHLLPDAIEKPGQELKAILGAELPPSVELDAAYAGPARIVVPTVRTGVETGESLSLKVIILSPDPVIEAELHWRNMGKGEYKIVPLEKVARSVYRVSRTAATADFEYFIRVRTGDKTVFFPVTAPSLNQTVVVMK
jgi:hypothetical protein